VSRRAVIGFGVIALLLVVVIGIVGSGADEGVPLDPDNSRPTGTRAVRLLIEELGAEVTVTENQPGDADVVVVLRDRLLEESRERLLAFAADGATLVVADPSSPLANGRGTRPPGSGNECIVESWQSYEITLVEPPAPPLDPDGGPFCLGTETGAVVTVRAEGSGSVVSLATPALLTNEHIGANDNARLAVAALAPRAGTRVTMLDPGHIETPLPGSGDQNLWDLVPAGVKWALLMLALAFTVFVLAVGRRHGRPVVETPVVELPSSELVAATGTLYERARQPSFAAGVLQDDLRRLVADRTGVPVHASVADLAQAAERQFGIPGSRVEAVLGATITDEAALLDIAHDLTRLRQEVLDG